MARTVTIPRQISAPHRDDEKATFAYAHWREADWQIDVKGLE